MRKSDIKFLKSAIKSYEFNNLKNFLLSGSEKEEKSFKQEKNKALLALTILLSLNILTAVVVVFKSSLIFGVIEFAFLGVVCFPIIIKYSKTLKEKHILGYLSVLKKRHGKEAVLNVLQTAQELKSDYKTIGVETKSHHDTLLFTDVKKNFKDQN